MRILHLSTFDIMGGAARAAYRLHKSLIKSDVDSKMLVRRSYSKDLTIYSNRTLTSSLGAKLDQIPVNKYSNKNYSLFSPQWFPDSLVRRVQQINPDIIHLHWVCNGYLQIESLPKFKQPIVWTLHDMWPFTGGCHYSKGCDRYTKGCGKCPRLGSTKDNDLSRKTWYRKYAAWKSFNLTLVAPSQWMEKCSRVSPLFEQCEIVVIPNGIDTNIYTPSEKKLARSVLNLPQNKHLLLFGASSTTSDPRKGFQHLVTALRKTYSQSWNTQLELVIFGESTTDNDCSDLFKAHYLGKLTNDAELALAYSAADVFIAPSIEDNLPNTILEALSCGTPCLAFDIGGMPDMIEHQKNGYLAEPFDANSLASGIYWLLDSTERHQKVSEYAREKTRLKFSLEEQSEKFKRLYRKILSNV